MVARSSWRIAPGEEAHLTPEGPTGGSGLAGLLVGLALLLEGGLRLWRTARGSYAPSLLGGLIADYLPPERRAYHAHRAAERRALLSLEER